MNDLLQIRVVRGYPWMCMECKPCSLCSKLDQEDKMLFCDLCDRGYHTFCVGLQEPPKGLWVCQMFCKGQVRAKLCRDNGGRRRRRALQDKLARSRTS